MAEHMYFMLWYMKSWLQSWVHLYTGVHDKYNTFIEIDKCIICKIHLKIRDLWDDIRQFIIFSEKEIFNAVFAVFVQNITTVSKILFPLRKRSLILPRPECMALLCPYLLLETHIVKLINEFWQKKR